MSDDWTIFASICTIIIVFSVWAGPRLLYYVTYYSRVKSSKDIRELPDINIPPEISALITRFNKSIRIRIADEDNAIPQAANFQQHPAYIIISKYALGQTNDEVAQLKTKHLLALVAHELGHIVLASKSTWLLSIFTSGAIGAWLFLFLTPVKFGWIGGLCSLIAFVIFMRAFNKVSRRDEYLADAFAVTDASVPANDLAEALTAIKLHATEQINSSAGQAKLPEAFRWIFGNSHPPIEYRIRRI